MSINRRRRLEALERRQIRGPSWRDPFPSVMRLWDDLQAIAAGNAVPNGYLGPTSSSARPRRTRSTDRWPNTIACTAG
jgi:hypothetical protein